MSSFIIPVADPGAPRQQTFPDVVRGSTVEGFLLRDRFIYSTSRRNLVSFPNYSTTSTVPVATYGVYSQTSSIATGGLWIVGYAEKGSVVVTINGTSYTHSFGTTASSWSQLVTPTYSLGASIPITVVVAKSAGEPYLNLYGLAVYEERLSTAQLP